MKKIFKVFMIGMILSGLLVSCKNNTDEPKNDVDTEQSGGKDENQNNLSLSCAMSLASSS